MPSATIVLRRLVTRRDAQVVLELIEAGVAVEGVVQDHVMQGTISTDRSRRALVSGGTQGTGAAIASVLRRDGIDVWTTARSMPDGYAWPDRFVPADLMTPAGTTSVGEAMAAVGGVDVLVHVVGGSFAPAGGFRVIEDEFWEQGLQLNLLAAVRLDRALLPR